MNIKVFVHIFPVLLLITAGRSNASDLTLPSAVPVPIVCYDLSHRDLPETGYSIVALSVPPDDKGRHLAYLDPALWRSGQLNPAHIFTADALQTLEKEVNELAKTRTGADAATMFYQEVYWRTFSQVLNWRGLTLDANSHTRPLPTDKRWWVPIATVPTAKVDAVIDRLCQKQAGGAPLRTEPPTHDVRHNHPPKKPVEAQQVPHARRHAQVPRTPPAPHHSVPSWVLQGKSF